MRLIRNILIVLLAAAAFLLGMSFVSANATVVPLDLLMTGWQWQLPLGWLLMLVLLAGLAIGLLVGIGLKGLLGPGRRGKP